MDSSKPPAQFSSWLLKQGGRFKTWKRRYFVLSIRQRTLSYYETDTRHRLLGVIDLALASSIAVVDASKLLFELKTPSQHHGSYLMQAEDETVLNSFLDLIGWILDSNREFVVLKEGVLRKQTWLQNWKERYCVLCPRYILYFMDKKDMEKFKQMASQLRENFQHAIARLEKAHGAILLQHCIVTRSSSSFTLTTPRNIFTFIAKSEFECDEWVVEVEKEIDLFEQMVAPDNEFSLPHAKGLTDAKFISSVPVPVAETLRKLTEQKLQVVNEKYHDLDREDEETQPNHRLSAQMEQYIMRYSISNPPPDESSQTLDHEYFIKIVIGQAKLNVSCDSYVKILLGDSVSETTTMEATDTPCWNATLSLSQKEFPDVLFVELYRENSMGTDILMGRNIFKIAREFFDHLSPFELFLNMVDPSSHKVVAEVFAQIRMYTKSGKEMLADTHKRLMDVIADFQLENLTSQEVLLDNVTTNEKFREEFAKFVELARKGVTLVKHSRFGPPRARLVTLNLERGIVDWATGSLAIESITSVQAGKLSDLWMRVPDEVVSASLCFSIVSNRRTLDLQAPSEEVRDQWVEGFNYIISGDFGSIIKANDTALPEPSARKLRISFLQNSSGGSSTLKIPQSHHVKPSIG